MASAFVAALARLDPLPGDVRVKAIMANEALERFAYYSSRAVLALYLNSRLGFSEAETVSLFAFYVAACYISPIVGGYIGDVWWGKWKTMVIFNIIYLFGLLVMGLTSFVDSRWGALAGLALMALGTGGIKPNAGPFGADQLPPGDSSSSRSFWLLWYFTITLGSIAAYVVAPAVRQAAGYGAAYLCSFGALAVSLAVFLLPSRRYVYVPPSGKSVYATIAHVLAAAAAGGAAGGRNAASGDGRGDLNIGAVAGVDDATPGTPGAPAPPRRDANAVLASPLRSERTPLISKAAGGGAAASSPGALEPPLLSLGDAATPPPLSQGDVGAAPPPLSDGIERSASHSKDGKLLLVGPRAVAVGTTARGRGARGVCCACLDLERARGAVPDADLDGVAAFLGLVPLFACLSAFWALYDSQAS